jgi:hypothetical protein
MGSHGAQGQRIHRLVAFVGALAKAGEPRSALFSSASSREQREEFALPPRERALRKEVAKADQQVEIARKRAQDLKRRASQRLRAKLGISIREVGALLGVSGGRAQQLLKDK